MKNFWITTMRRLAAGAIVAGATTFYSAMCYANAFDSASDPVYADGWQAGDNGGTGFTPWNFDAGYVFAGTNYTYVPPIFAQIDDGLQGGTQFSNPHNAIGRSWAIGASPTDTGSTHIGRGFAPLQVGQTLRATIDNPTKRVFFKGYFIRLNGGSGGTNGNVCNVGYGCSHPNFPTGNPYPAVKSGFDRFEYFTYGQWNLDDAAGTGTGVFDTDTAAAGAVLSWTRTGAETYDFRVDTFVGGVNYSASRTFSNPGPAPDWIEFVFFNANATNGQGFSDTTPTLQEPGTDLYIRSIEIVPEPATATLMVLGAGTLWGIGTARRRREE